MRGLSILAVSPVGGYGGFNTSIHRVRALRSMGCSVQVIDSAAGSSAACRKLLGRIQNKLFQSGLTVGLPDIAGAQTRLLAEARHRHWDLVWLEKALTVGPATILKIRASTPESQIIGFSPDDMNARHNQSAQFLRALPLYDCFITTKTYNVLELERMGCPRALFVGNGFDPDAFRPLPVGTDDVARLGGDIGFIGTYERERAEMMLYLAGLGFQIRVWGDGWKKMTSKHPNLRLELRPLFGDDFARACASFKINLGFLRKINRDQQTTRSVEIPACGGFMLAERTTEHLELFVEGQEAEFFSSREELASKCLYYLSNEAARFGIATAGLERCTRSGYSNAARLREVLAEIMKRSVQTS